MHQDMGPLGAARQPRAPPRGGSPAGVSLSFCGGYCRTSSIFSVLERFLQVLDLSRPVPRQKKCKGEQLYFDFLSCWWVSSGSLFALGPRLPQQTLFSCVLGSCLVMGSRAACPCMSSIAGLWTWDTAAPLQLLTLCSLALDEQGSQSRAHSGGKTVFPGCSRTC